MQTSLFELAYTNAARHYKTAQLAVFSELLAASPNSDFDSVHHVSVRAMNLHTSALTFAERVEAKSITCEMAESSLLAKFQEFPKEVVRHALSAACAAAR
jgi:hypothetical protein